MARGRHGQHEPIYAAARTIFPRARASRARASRARASRGAPRPRAPRHRLRADVPHRTRRAFLRTEPGKAPRIDALASRERFVRDRIRCARVLRTFAPAASPRTSVRGAIVDGPAGFTNADERAPSRHTTCTRWLRERPACLTRGGDSESFEAKRTRCMSRTNPRNDRAARERGADDVDGAASAPRGARGRVQPTWKASSTNDFEQNDSASIL